MRWEICIHTVHDSATAAYSSPTPTSTTVEYQIAFSVPSDSLPGPLPSIEAVESSPKITDLFSRHSAGSEFFMLSKFGVGVYQLDAETMRFAREQRPDIRIPQVYAVYECEHPEYSHTVTYIVMEKIQGETLQSKWLSLTKDEKLGFAQQVKTCLDSLRTIPHEALFACLNKTELQDTLFTSTDPDSDLNGPFKTEQALVASIINKYERNGTDIYVGGETATIQNINQMSQNNKCK
ncbi:hypothetical protein NLG97_g8618 [Lecanicillium saksenae]|uniref:Uncharacterized protein n=1 Tax=Lecanicillium saksenae TaxID=468837 RepID=A0ACC1QK08_9HYPO|nr:hypothetical protein NLG97_g8618 [Lecanicillium saksenae]